MFKRSISVFAFWICTVIWFGFTSGLGATTIVVDQGGSGDFTTIPDALVAAVDGDVIQVNAGTYHESLVVDKSVTIEGVSGCAATTLDGDGCRQIMSAEGMVSVTLRGLTFTRGYASDAAALMIWNGAVVEVENCRFLENYAWKSNAVHVRHTGSSGSFFNCEFRDNTAAMHSAALSCDLDCHLLQVEDCIFADNTSNGVSGAVNCNAGQVVFCGNLFLRNQGLGAGALAIMYDSWGDVSGNTFYENRGRDHGSVYITAPVTFNRNIVTSDMAGPGLACGYSTEHSCNLYFENAAGAIRGSVLGEDEIEADPLFCEWTLDNFFLCSLSPALAENNGCGTMGAFEQGCTECGPVPAQRSTWGDLKSMYR